MNKENLDEVYNLYSRIWKKRCSEFSNEPPISIIKEAPSKIVVIGDLHGDWNATIKSLKAGGVIDDNNKWIGNDTIVVQLGDQIDRCRLDKGPCHLSGATINDEASDMKILEYFSDLHKQASKYGGAVYSILGNHEMMNVHGDFRYVSQKNLLDFTLDGTIESGINNRKEQFKPGNKIANFLACTRRVIMVIGNNLFVHAGIVPEIANKYNVDNINAIVALYLFDQLKDSSKYNDLLTDPHLSPLWTRKLGNLNRIPNPEYVNNMCNEIFDSGMLSNLLGTEEKHPIKRIFIGHTPQILKGVNSMCNGKIWYMDTGASAAFDGFKPKSGELILPVAIINGDMVYNPFK